MYPQLVLEHVLTSPYLKASVRCLYGLSVIELLFTKIPHYSESLEPQSTCPMRLAGCTQGAAMPHVKLLDLLLA